MGVQTIVVGVDFSAMSEIAIRHAMLVAKRTGAKVVLVHVTAMPEQPDGLPPSMQDTAAAYLEILRARAAEAQAELAALAMRFAGDGVTIAERLIDGFADDGLLRAASEAGAELIVTGSHGRRGARRLLLGSTAERVVRTAPCSVLVARGEPTAYRSVLVATDFTDAAEHALDLALDVAAEDATIDVVHFWDAPPLSRGHATAEVDDTVAEIRAGLILHGNARGADAIARRGDAGARLRYHLREGDATEGIAELAVAQGCELVAVGGHGRRGLRRLLLGSVAEATVRHAPCSVLVAR